MKVYFAAVGNELMGAFLRSTKNEDKNLLFSFWELSGRSGFKQRKKNFENIAKERESAITKERVAEGATTT